MKMQSQVILQNSSPAARTAAGEPPFGVNEVRLSARQWLVALGIVAACIIATPRVWKKIEKFQTSVDYRIPYALSKDYWLYQRRLEELAGPDKVIVLGDSVVWGEYVQASGTLSHFLAQETGRPDGFVNCGMNGLFPLAMEGLVEHYGSALSNRKVILHCNVLWMTSPQADLSSPKEQVFNHSRLVAQFRPRIPCYTADASERLSVLIERNVGFSAWVGHLQNAYFEQKSVPDWTLVQDEGNPPGLPNAWHNPVAQITLRVGDDPRDDAQRGPGKPRHKAWSEGGAGPAHFDWVELDRSLQWAAFQRTIGLLRQRGNDVLVILGPFNEHMVAEDQRPDFRRLCSGIAAWLGENHIALVAPETLPSQLYGDASHPLTDGYALLAQRISRDEAFRRWLKEAAARPR
jgi:hypothetical protein